MIRKSGHRGIDDLLARIEHFLGGVADREPIGDIWRSVRHAPVLAVGVRETGPGNLDRSVVGEMGSQGGDHGFLLGKEGRVPKDRNRCRDPVFVEGEEGAARLGDRTGNPVGLGELRVDPQEHFLARRGRSRHFRIEEAPFINALGRLEISPVLPDADTVHAGIGQNCVLTGNAGRGKGKNTPWDLGRS